VKIDVVVLTKNSERTWKDCLNAIYDAIPLNKLIVVDDFSEDGTIDIIKGFPNCFLIQNHALREKAREIGIKLVETEWFAFVDSDIVLYSNWFDKIRKHVRPDVGAICGDVIVVSSERKEYVDLDAVLRKLRGLVYKSALKELKIGFTGNALVRTALVKNLRFPKWMHFYEDHCIKEHILRQNFKWLDLDIQIREHYNSPEWKKQALRQSGACGRLLGYRSLPNLIVNLVKMPFKSLFAMVLLGNLRVFLYNFCW